MEKCSEFPGQQIPPEPEPDGTSPASQLSLPTETEECQAGYTPPLGWVDPLSDGHAWDCDCPGCAPAKYLDELDEVEDPPLSFDIETPASPYRWLPPPPVAKPQKISLPLDPRKGGEILLSAEAVQLAMSGVPEGGEDNQSQKQFLGITAPPVPKYVHYLNNVNYTLGYQWKGVPVNAKMYYCGNSANLPESDPMVVSPSLLKEAYEKLIATESPLYTCLEKK